MLGEGGGREGGGRERDGDGEKSGVRDLIIQRIDHPSDEVGWNGRNVMCSFFSKHIYSDPFLSSVCACYDLATRALC